MDFSEIMTVELHPHIDKVPRMTAVGMQEDEVHHAQYRVFVHGDRIAQFNAGQRYLCVGYIGTHAGANFCPIATFYRFVLGQRDWIVSEAKRLHGAASPEPITDVPPHL